MHFDLAGDMERLEDFVVKAIAMMVVVARAVLLVRVTLARDEAVATERGKEMETVCEETGTFPASDRIF
jgi:hypothetical protein